MADRARSSGWRIAVAAVGAVVVAGVVLAASAASGPGSTVRIGRPDLTPVLVVAAVVIGATGLAVLVDLLRGLERGPLRRHHRTVRDVAWIVLLVAIVLVVVTMFPEGGETVRFGEAGDGGAEGEVLPEEGDGRFWVGLAVMAVTVAVVVLTVRGRRPWRGTSEPDEPARLAAEVGEVLDDVIAELRGQADPRRAVIAAYARMEDVFARHGLPRRPSEAPLEFLARALQRVGEGSAVGRLTDLFERAMFSTEAFDRARQDDAIDALVAVRDDLRRQAMAAPGAGRPE